MESHPEEFKSRSEPYYERWASHMEALREYGNETDNAAIVAKLRDIRLGEIHEHVMDELLNGPERRRKEEEEREYERQMLTQGRLAQQQQAYQSQLGSYQNAAGAQGLGIGTQSPSQPLVIQSGGRETMRIQANGDIQIGNETINEGLLKNIKKALKL
jgi:hypothetical protein